MANERVPSKTLNDGTTLPAIGFGTYRLRGESGVRAIRSAIDAGYRLLDSATNYENEGAVGSAVRASGVPREELRVVSKLAGRHQRFGDATRAIEESLYRTGLDYLDMYLIHWPNPSRGLYVEAWSALVAARERGLVRSIGVCNFLPEHLARAIDATGETPSVNQVELSPYFPQRPQRAFHHNLGILTESWSPLGRSGAFLQDPVLARVAGKYGKSVAQLVLRWHVQLGAVPLPKATGPERQAENLDLFDFEITPEDMDLLSACGRADGRSFDQDPATHEED